MTGIESSLIEKRIFNPPEDFANSAKIKNMMEYTSLCSESDEDYEGYWRKKANE